MKKYRVLRTGHYEFCIEQKFLWFWIRRDELFGSLERAECFVFRLMENDEMMAYPARVVGDSGEYELRYLRQRIEEMEKDK